MSELVEERLIPLKSARFFFKNKKVTDPRTYDWKSVFLKGATSARNTANPYMSFDSTRLMGLMAYAELMEAQLVELKDKLHLLSQEPKVGSDYEEKMEAQNKKIEELTKTISALSKENQSEKIEAQNKKIEELTATIEKLSTTATSKSSNSSNSKSKNGSAKK